MTREFQIEDEEKLTEIRKLLDQAMRSLIEIPPDVQCTSAEMGLIKQLLESFIISAQLRGMGRIKQAGDFRPGEDEVKTEEDGRRYLEWAFGQRQKDILKEYGLLCRAGFQPATAVMIIHSKRAGEG